MDGWETRRHNRAAFDYAIIRLGVSSGTISGIEIDTSFFQGNEAPAISVEGCYYSSSSEVVSWKGERAKWEVILGIQKCGPSQRHAWKLETPTNKAFTHVRLNMYPDGGTARFKLTGKRCLFFLRIKMKSLILQLHRMEGCPLLAVIKHLARWLVICCSQEGVRIWLIGRRRRGRERKIILIG